MIYALSDTHLSFTTDKPMNVFGTYWENHHEKIKENWTKLVNDDDTVVIAGDLSWGMSLEEAKEDLLFLDRLPGKKIILKGNHDYWWATKNKLDKFFEENSITTLNILHNSAFVVEDRIICGTRGWINEFGVKSEDERLIKREAQRLEISLEEGKKLKEQHPGCKMTVFMHYPPVFGGFINYDIVDVLYRYGIEEVYYGHLHNVRESQLDKEYIGIRLILTACDYLGFEPLALPKI